MNIENKNIKTEVDMAVVHNELKHINTNITELRTEVKIFGEIKEAVSKNCNDLNDLNDWQKEVKKWISWFSKTVFGTIIIAILTFLFTLGK